MSDIEINKISLQHDIDQALAIRREVFINEQGVDEDEELDSNDEQSTHYLLRFQDNIAGTARVRYVDNNKAKIERVAILAQYRGKKLGQRLMQFILEDIKHTSTVHSVHIGSQKHAIPFYKTLGFIEYSIEYMEAGIPHLDMQLIFI